MARLTDKQKKKMIADRVDGASIRALAGKYGVSTTTVQRIVKSDTQLIQKVTQKKEQNTADILAYMETKKDMVCGILDLFLDALTDPDKISKATLPQITTSIGTLIDKFAAVGSADKSDAKSTGVVLLPSVPEVKNE